MRHQRDGAQRLHLAAARTAAAARLVRARSRRVCNLAGDVIAEVVSVAPPLGQRHSRRDLIWRTGDSMAYVSQSQWIGRAQERLQHCWCKRWRAKAASAPPLRVGDAQSNYEVRWDVTRF